MTQTINHARKVNRALALSGIGAHPQSASAMLSAIPDEVIDALPARLIAQILDANWTLAESSKAIAEREAVQQGCVWDAKAQRHRDIAA